MARQNRRFWLGQHICQYSLNCVWERERERERERGEREGERERERGERERERDRERGREGERERGREGERGRERERGERERGRERERESMQTQTQTYHRCKEPPHMSVDGQMDHLWEPQWGNSLNNKPTIHTEHSHSPPTHGTSVHMASLCQENTYSLTKFYNKKTDNLSLELNIL